MSLKLERALWIRLMSLFDVSLSCCQARHGCMVRVWIVSAADSFASSNESSTCER